MEYLMTYGWALLVIVVVIAILLIINPFSAPQGCRFDQVGFQCANNVVIDSNGMLFMSITNANNNAIKVFSVICTADKTATAPAIGTLFTVPAVQRQASFNINSTNPLSTGVICTKDNSAYKPPAGTEFSGKVWVFYKNDEDGGDYPYRTVSANVVTKTVQATGAATPPLSCSNGFTLSGGVCMCGTNAYATGQECCTGAATPFTCAVGHCTTTQGTCAP